MKNTVGLVKHTAAKGDIMTYIVYYWTYTTQNKAGQIGKGSKKMSEVCPYPEDEIINDEQLLELIHSKTVTVMIMHKKDGTSLCCVDDIKCRFQQR